MPKKSLFVLFVAFLIFISSFYHLRLQRDKLIQHVPAATNLAPTLLLNTITPSLIPTPSILGKNVEEMKVSRVIDGDTIVLENGQTIRYIGIDTPELHHPRKPVQCFASAAAAKNSELVAGKKVRLQKDVSETDRYGRLLRYVYVGDIFVNDYLVKNGYAHAATFPPDVEFESQFRASQREAEEQNRGLWSTCQNVGNNTVEKFPTTAQKSPNPNCVIKGNINPTTGEKIYHLPGQHYYDKTIIDETRGEKWFCSAEEAEHYGFRKAKL